MGTHRPYDRPFKERVAKMRYERDNIKTLAAELGIAAERIYKRRREFSEHREASGRTLWLSAFSDRSSAK